MRLYLFCLVYSAIAGGAATVLLLQTVSAAPAAPVSAIDWYTSEPPSAAAQTFENPAATEESPLQSEIIPVHEEFLPAGSVGGSFDSGKVDFGISDDKSAIQINPDTCVYPDSYFRTREQPMTIAACSRPVMIRRLSRCGSWC